MVERADRAARDARSCYSCRVYSCCVYSCCVYSCWDVGRISTSLTAMCRRASNSERDRPGDVVGCHPLHPGKLGCHRLPDLRPVVAARQFRRDRTGLNQADPHEPLRDLHPQGLGEHPDRELARVVHPLASRTRPARDAAGDHDVGHPARLLLRRFEQVRQHSMRGVHRTQRVELGHPAPLAGVRRRRVRPAAASSRRSPRPCRAGRTSRRPRRLPRGPGPRPWCCASTSPSARPAGSSIRFAARRGGRRAGRRRPPPHPARRG